MVTKHRNVKRWRIQFFVFPVAADLLGASYTFSDLQ